MNPLPDSVEHSIGSFVRRRLNTEQVGQVVAIIFHASGVGYRIQWEDSVDEHLAFELRGCAPPDETVA